jgi:hypothetical protein
VANLQSRQYAGPCKGAIHLPSYISGYFDGEGCFTVSFSPREKLNVGWETRPSVSVSQNRDRSEVISEIAGYFECGTIRPDPSDQTVKWETRNLADIRRRVLPHFDVYQLRSGKQRDVEILREICLRMSDRQHLTVEGLRSIVELTTRMNPSGSRRYDQQTMMNSLCKVKA